QPSAPSLRPGRARLVHRPDGGPVRHARGAVVDHRRGPVPPLRSALPGPRPLLPARGRHLRPAACADDHRLARLRRRAHHRHAHPRAEPCPRGLALHATV
ncbi:MAG: hypothetical protein AVDCRST_MAG15-595, partial [uncultured Rubellimicrobium sp.]